MELCTSCAISNLPHHRLFSTIPTHHYWKTSTSPKKTTISDKNPGLLYSATPVLRATSSEETSTSDGVITMEKTPMDEKNVPYETLDTEVPKEEASMVEQMQVLEFLDKLKIKLDSEDTNSVILYGSGALVTLWLASTVVGAMDSIPLFPKVMEVVGLAFTIWFSSRYLIFKKNRDELSTKIEELKQQVLGSTDD